MKIRKNRILLSLIFSFLLGSYNGYIALWKNSDPEPICIWEYPAAALPAADRAALERGIRIETQEELVRILEDYLS